MAEIIYFFLIHIVFQGVTRIFFDFDSFQDLFTLPIWLRELLLLDSPLYCNGTQVMGWTDRSLCTVTITGMYTYSVFWRFEPLEYIRVEPFPTVTPQVGIDDFLKNSTYLVKTPKY